MRKRKGADLRSGFTERIYRADPRSRCRTDMGDKMRHFNDVCFLFMFFVMGCKVVLTSYTPISIK
jgi:hypothetical protein